MHDDDLAEAEDPRWAAVLERVGPGFEEDLREQKGDDELCAQAVAAALGVGVGAAAAGSAAVVAPVADGASAGATGGAGGSAWMWLLGLSLVAVLGVGGWWATQSREPTVTSDASSSVEAPLVREPDPALAQKLAVAPTPAPAQEEGPDIATPAPPMTAEPASPVPPRTKPERSAKPRRSAEPAETKPAPAKPTTAAELFAEANAARRRHDDKVAAATYDQLLDAHPRSREARTSRVALGRLLLDRLHKPGRALVAFEAYLAVAPGGALAEEARVGRAKALRALGRGAQEQGAWEAVLKHHPKSVHAAQARARIAALSG